MAKTIETVDGFGITLDVYQGKYALRHDRAYNDKWYWVMCRLVFGKDEKLADKASPVKTPLGDRKRAGEVLNQLLDQLCDGGKDDDDDIPF